MSRVIKTGCHVLVDGKIYNGDLRPTEDKHIMRLTGIAKDANDKPCYTELAKFSSDYEPDFVADFVSNGVSDTGYSFIFLKNSRCPSDKFIDYISLFDSVFISRFKANT